MKSLNSLLKLCIATSTVAASLVAQGGQASATEVGVQACSPVIIGASYVRMNYSGKVVGAVQLRRDTCGRYWAYVRFYGGLASGDAWGTAYITRFENGIRQSTLNCGSRGGTGHVTMRRGNEECVTPKVRGLTSKPSFIASSVEYFDHFGELKRVASGQTRRMR